MRMGVRGKGGQVKELARENKGITEEGRRAGVRDRYITDCC